MNMSSVHEGDAAGNVSWYSESTTDLPIGGPHESQ